MNVLTLQKHLAADGMLVKFVDGTCELKIALSLFLCPLCIDGCGEGDGVIPHFADE